jgi:mannose/cellobiose epimerase-like protein (N-acyl-D-glucosamine 2-epimerase family)
MQLAAQSFAQLQDAAQRLRRWLFDDALPRWSVQGVDQQTGAFLEALSLENGRPVQLPHRAFVQHRQIYSLLEGQRLGWSGDALSISEHALGWFFRYFLGENGCWVHLVDSKGQCLDPTTDLYDQAFVLFGCAAAARALPAKAQRLEIVARDLVAALSVHHRNTAGGFHEADAWSRPRRANPHMHLLEAFLAWEEVSDDPLWSEASDALIALAQRRLIDPHSGVLREFFDAEWQPFPGDLGRQIEPGHHFEWAWLLQRWAVSRADPQASRVARRLFDIAAQYGMCPQRQVAVLEVNDDFSSRQPLARLWGQTEWLKAALVLAEASEGDRQASYLESAVRAVAALELYLNAAPAGLWRDKMREDGTFVEEPAPASSLYHITCAISELDAVVKRLSI